MAFHLVETIPPGFSTLWNSTTGPAVKTNVEKPLAQHGFAPGSTDIYVSKQEAWEIARLFGFVEPAVHAQTISDNKVLLAEVERLTDELDAKTKQVDALKGLVVAPAAMATTTNGDSGFAFGPVDE